ncbi:hypothetical protein O6H91_08G081200 [Diphasiastrum complanatum]|uniref:Uncharacterized protein n=1 Tax=Diphasiastrum complanatum TaxID=34168 RepID=A0ACC2CZC3_DIPCM|nr:hypothetical protein O6H91_08G081200 [Diphasiastrum complanatum]
MSGATLAAGPRKRGGSGECEDSDSLGGVMGSLRVIQLQLVAFIIVFSASGLVPLVDLAFPVFVSIYTIILTTLVFPSPKNPSSQEIFRGNRVFQVYVALGTVIGLFFPLSYVLGGFARGDRRAVRAATPHLFLLSFQILSENVIRSLGICSLPVRALLPIIYSARRLFSLSDWVHATFVEATLPPNPNFQDKAWLLFGKGLSAANFFYFSLNLVVFLIPLFLPKAFKRYFKDIEKERSKPSIQNGEEVDVHAADANTDVHAADANTKKSE